MMTAANLINFMLGSGTCLCLCHGPHSSRFRKKTRRERLKSALYLRLKKRKVFKIVKGYPLEFLKLKFAAKYQNTWRTFGDKKIEKQ